MIWMGSQSGGKLARLYLNWGEVAGADRFFIKLCIPVKGQNYIGITLHLSKEEGISQITIAFR